MPTENQTDGENVVPPNGASSILNGAHPQLPPSAEEDYEDQGRHPRRLHPDSTKIASRRGFAAMDEAQQRQIASQGGRTPRSGPRGFAAMDARSQSKIAAAGGRAEHLTPRGFAAIDEARQREIASRGGRAQHDRPRGFAAMDAARRKEIARLGGRASRADANTSITRAE